MLLPGRVARLGIELTISPGWDSRLGSMTGAMCGAIRWGQIDIEGTHVRESRSARLIVCLRGHLKIILYPRNVYKRDIMMGLWWGHFMPVGEVMMEVIDTWEPGRKEFFRNLFQSAGVTPGPCEKWAELGSSPPFFCHQLHHLISEDKITSMIHHQCCNYTTNVSV